MERPDIARSELEAIEIIAEDHVKLIVIAKRFGVDIPTFVRAIADGELEVTAEPDPIPAPSTQKEWVKLSRSQVATLTALAETHGALLTRGPAIGRPAWREMLRRIARGEFTVKLQNVNHTP